MKHSRKNILKLRRIATALENNLTVVLLSLFIVAISFQAVGGLFSQDLVEQAMAESDILNQQAITGGVNEGLEQQESAELNSLDVLDQDTLEETTSQANTTEGTSEILPVPKPAPIEKALEPNSVQEMFVELSKQYGYLEQSGELAPPIKDSIEEVLQNITSDFGERDNPVANGIEITFHDAIDIDADLKEQVHSIYDGVVIYTEYSNEGYGNSVAVYHGNELITFYAHLSKISVDVGDKVESGQTIGEAGDTGIATGVHLHFEVISDGKLLNPTYFLNLANY